MLRMFIVTKESGTFWRNLVIPSFAIKIAISNCTIFFFPPNFTSWILILQKCLSASVLPPRRLSSRDWRKVSFVDSASKQPPGGETCNTTLQHSNIERCYSAKRDLQHNSTTQQHCKLWYNTTRPQSIEWCQERPAASGEPIFPMQFRRNLWRS